MVCTASQRSACRTWQKLYVPSETLVADESMLAWMGKHMPGWIIVPRKPKPQGLEWKTLCDAKTKLLLNIDIQEGKLRNAAKEFNDTHKRSTGCTLRLLKPWFGSGRTLIADSWFGSTTTAIAMYNVAGCYCILNVKTAHQHFPREELKGALNESDDVATYMSSFTATDGKAVEIFASGQMEKQPLLLVATCATDQPGEPRVFIVTVKESNGSTVRKTISYATTVVHGKYRGQFSAVDIWNRIRQG